MFSPPVSSVEQNSNNIREKRLRPERPRREIPDFDYSYSAMSAHISAIENSAERVRMDLPEGDDVMDERKEYARTEQGLQVHINV